MFSNLLTHARHINSPTRNRHNLFTPSLLALSIGSLLSTGATAQTLNLSSPDKQIVLSLSDDTGRPEYQIHFHGKTVIEPSRLGLVFASLGELGQGLRIKSSHPASANEKW
ncbi:glycoside hydrolase family 97 N-terminal domain-containing protein, partial [Shewanella xiamenensis]